MASRTGTGYAAQLFGVTLGYVALGLWGLGYASLQPIVSLVWPASGLALAALLLGGFKLWPGVAMGAYVVNLNTGIGVAPSAIIAAGNTLEAIVAWHLLTRHMKFDSDLGHTRDVFALLLAAMLAPLVAATLGSQVYGLILHGPQTVHAWLGWWMGDMTGILLVTPLILVWRNPLPQLPLRRWPELLALAGALSWVSWQAFFTVHRSDAYPLALALLPFLLWAALRFGRHGVTVFTAGAALLAMFGTLGGAGPFAAGAPFQVMFLWWEYATLVAVVGLLVAAQRTERAQAWLALERSHGRMENDVRQRTAQLQEANQMLQVEMAAREALEHRLVHAGEQRKRRFGQDLHDGLGQHLTAIALMASGLARALGERAPVLAPQAERLVAVVGEAQAEGRALALGMYPATLEKLGLEAAIEELARFTTERESVRCTLEVSKTPLPRMSRTLSIHVYRIAQEAVHNAVRHGQAKRIEIILRASQPGLEMIVRDDGCGFDPASAQEKNRLGFNLMRQRAAVLGGKLSVHSAVGDGAEIRLLCTGCQEAPT